MASFKDFDYPNDFYEEPEEIGRAGKGLLGTVMTGSALAMKRASNPGGLRRMYADYAHNYLPGFYSGKPGAKHQAYAQEFTNTLG